MSMLLCLYIRPLLYTFRLQFHIIVTYTLFTSNGKLKPIVGGRMKSFEIYMR